MPKSKHKYTGPTTSSSYNIAQIQQNAQISQYLDFIDLKANEQDPNTGISREEFDSRYPAGTYAELSRAYIPAYFEAEKARVEYWKTNPSQSELTSRNAADHPNQLWMYPGQTGQVREGNVDFTNAIIASVAPIGPLRPSIRPKIGLKKVSYSSAPKIGVDEAGRYLTQEELVAAEVAGRNQYNEFIDNPVVKNTYKHNIDVQKRVGKWNQHQAEIEKLYQENRAIAGTEPIYTEFYNDINDIRSAYYSGAGKVGNGIEEIGVNTKLGTTSKDVSRSWFHELLHRGGSGDKRFLQEKSERLLKSNYEDVFNNYGIDVNYFTNPKNEIVPNIFDVANIMGIKIGQKYPGIDAFKDILKNNYNNLVQGGKQWVVESMKLNTPRDYKRLWDQMTGRYVVGATGVGYG